MSVLACFHLLESHPVVAGSLSIELYEIAFSVTSDDKNVCCGAVGNKICLVFWKIRELFLFFFFSRKASSAFCYKLCHDHLCAFSECMPVILIFVLFSR